MEPSSPKLSVRFEKISEECWLVSDCCPYLWTLAAVWDLQTSNGSMKSNGNHMQ